MDNKLNVLHISLLADHPEFIEILAPLVAEHWRPILTNETTESRGAKFRTHLNFDSLPIAWVAHSETQVFGTAALRIEDLPGYEHITPWLGGVYVIHEFRNRGIGEALCMVVEREAKKTFGISKLYLFTLDKQLWYQKLGWNMLETCVWCGYPGDIMVKML